MWRQSSPRNTLGPIVRLRVRKRVVQAFPIVSSRQWACAVGVWYEHLDRQHLASNRLDARHVHNNSNERILINVAVSWNKNIVKTEQVKKKGTKTWQSKSEISTNQHRKLSLLWLSNSVLFSGIFLPRKLSFKDLTSLEVYRGQHCLEQQRKCAFNLRKKMRYVHHQLAKTSESERISNQEQ